MSTYQITCIVGARPNFMKVAAILRELRQRAQFRPRLIHTGQHFSPEMSESFFRDLELPEPDEYLGVRPGTQTEQTAEIMRLLETSFSNQRPDLVIIAGDVTSTLAAALVASKLGIPVAHVEAGLRSFDRRMPEEINRVVADALSDYLFITEPSGRTNLLAEGIPENRLFLVGNVMIDTLLRFRERASNSPVLQSLGLKPRHYALVTLHRPSNVDDAAHLAGLISMFQVLAAELPVVFPVHPRTRLRMEETGINAEGLVLTPPQTYLDFLRLMSEARMVITDSGGIQEETTILGVPCLTARENTERPVTIDQGTNRLVGTEPAAILAAARTTLTEGVRPGRTPDLWDGRASVRIADVLEEVLGRGTGSNLPTLAFTSQRATGQLRPLPAV